MFEILTILIGILGLFIYFWSRKKHPEKKQVSIIGNLSVYFGTQTGKSEQFARILAREALERGINASLKDLEQFDVDLFMQEEWAVIICSTHGEGEPPDSAKKFYYWLKNCIKNKQSTLEQLHFGVFAVGSSDYQYYNTTGINIDQYLNQCGARRIMQVGLGDEYKGTLNNDFDIWKQALFKLLPGKFSKPKSVFLKYAKKNKTQKLYSRWALEYMKAFKFQVIHTQELKKTNQESTLLVQLETQHSYQVAQNLGIYPENSQDLVEELIDMMNYDCRAIIDYQNHEFLQIPFPTPSTTQNVFTKFVDLSGPVNQNIIKSLIDYACDDIQKQELELLSDAQNYEIFCQKVLHIELNIVEFLKQYNSVKVPAWILAQILNPIQKRLYSISSSPNIQPSIIDLTISIHTFNRKIGMTSAYIQEMHQYNNFKEISCTFEETVFKIQDISKYPVVLICNGSGIAPFRGLLQDLKDQRNCKPIYLFYGLRNIETHFLYDSEIMQMCKATKELKQYQIASENNEGLISELYIAQSQVSPQVYIQKVVEHHFDWLYKMIIEQEGQIMVCGSSSLCQDIILLTRKAGEVVDKLIEDGKLIVEIWQLKWMIKLLIEEFLPKNAIKTTN